MSGSTHIDLAESILAAEIDMDLNALGLDSWFTEKTHPDFPDEFEPARVVTVNRDNYRIYAASGESLARVTGKILFGAESSLDFPAVGDWVTAQHFDDGSPALIHKVLPRKSLLKRKTPGKKVDFQLIGANIDCAFVMQSLDSNFNVNRLERYLVMIHEGGISPIVLLSKNDLISKSDLIQKRLQIKALDDAITVIDFSNETKAGLDVIRDRLEPKKTYCLIGSSGVGKTTLLNNLLGETHAQLPTREIRESDGRGRHTTTRRDLLILDNGAMLIDTPGMREIGNFDVGVGLDETFDHIASLSAECKFADCTHTTEVGCAVLEAVRSGELSGERLENFRKIKRESDYYERSYLEKRRRDKKFGKMVKAIMKEKKNRR